MIAIALGETVYLWNSVTGSVVDLFGDVNAGLGQIVTSVKWITDGDHIAVGFNDGNTQVSKSITFSERLKL